MDVAEHELQALYTWVDEIPLSRPKRNIARDFSDGVLMAELVHHYFPKIVELHNYSPANGMQQKMYNWNTLNAKVFKRLGFMVVKQDCEACCNCAPGAVERVLKLMKVKIEQLKAEQGEPLPLPVSNMGKALPGQTFQQAIAMPRNPSAPVAVSQSELRPAGGVIMAKMNAAIAPEVIAEKDQVITELRETNSILETKVRKLEQLVRLKEAKIQTLMAKLQAAGMA